MAASRAETIDTETAKLSLEEDTDNNDDLFASDVEADLEQVEAVIEDG